LFKWDDSIPRDGVVHVQGPGIDSALEVIKLGIAFFCKDVGGFEAAHSMVAMEDDGFPFLGIQFPVAGSEFLEGDVVGTFDPGGLDFVWEADIQEEGRVFPG
jgi:hypothetical protein